MSMLEEIDTFKFDTILTSLHDLQQAKSLNEVKLGEEYSIRKQLESKVSKAAANLRSLKVKHSNLLETERITEQKVLQLEKQIKQLEFLNQDKRNSIEDLNKKALLEEETQQSNLREFESIITELTGRFRNAPAIFTEENLDKSIEELEKDIRGIKSQVSSMKIQMEELSPFVVPDEPSDHQEELTEEQLRLVLQLFSSDGIATEEKRKRLENRKDELTEKSTKLVNAVEILEQELQEISKSNC